MIMEDILNQNKPQVTPAYQALGHIACRGCIINSIAIISANVVDPNPKELRHV